jgi:hypothetical protein
MARKRTARPEVVAKVEGKHVADCGAVRAVREGWWDTPWAAIHPKDGRAAVVYLDAAGRKTRHGSRRWLRFICNSTDCFATVLIRDSAICRLAPVGDVQRSRAGAGTGETKEADRE